MIKNILLFGGAFDPPHLGHVLLVQKALELVKPDELWLLPAFGSTFGKRMTRWQDRVAMLHACFDDGDPRVKISLFEIEHRLSGSTIETITLLKKIYSEHSFSFLIGSDQLASFQKWEQWQELLQQMQFYVYPRKGFPVGVQDFEPLLPGMKELKSPEISSVSSTEVRERLAKGESISDLVPASVAAYIAARPEIGYQR